jgi:hypothetical protein
MTETTRTADPTVRELPIAAGGELELKLGANRLRIRTTEGDRVVVRGRTEHDLERDLEITSGQDWVRVTDGPAGSLRLGPLTVRNGGRTPDLDIEVPRNVRISARTLSGSIEAIGIAAPSRWQSASGSIRIGADAGPLTIETMSGAAYVDAHGPLALTTRTVSGTVKIHARRLTALDVATTSGDITVDGVLDAGAVHTLTSVSGDVRLATGSEVTLSLQSVAGDIRAAMPHRSDGARGRRTVVVGSGRVKVEVRTMSGGVELKPGEPDTGPAGAGGGATAPRPTFWADFGRDWAESAKDWAESWKDWGREWGESWAAGRAWSSGRPEPVDAPAPPTPSTPPAAPAPPAPSPTSAPESSQAADDARARSEADGASETDTAPVPVPTPADVEAARLEVLRALERGELDVEAAADRLATLEVLAHEAP